MPLDCKYNGPEAGSEIFEIFELLEVLEIVEIIEILEILGIFEHCRSLPTRFLSQCE